MFFAYSQYYSLIWAGTLHSPLCGFPLPMAAPWPCRGLLISWNLICQLLSFFPESRCPVKKAPAYADVMKCSPNFPQTALEFRSYMKAWDPSGSWFSHRVSGNDLILPYGKSVDMQIYKHHFVKIQAALAAWCSHLSHWCMRLALCRCHVVFVTMAL